ncbi:hypothetical protein TNCT_201821 [Trichonephila clavata]|uniref:Uncharacterized protein n=1 Tax=Trichonephila clavata TaxID=2740835 RepID=A0A8X6GY40_TRICU|nr:hypothetical protein TNCT_201821 [Trichonephila clavata]
MEGTSVRGRGEMMTKKMLYGHVADSDLAPLIGKGPQLWAVLGKKKQSNSPRISRILLVPMALCSERREKSRTSKAC